ncbi:SRPBCC family protein [Geodermatophilus sp. SYSU D00766]
MTALLPPGPTAADLAREVRDVVADLPRFLTAPLLRPWHRHWGATPAEAAAPMPGDDREPRAQYRCTRAITVQAPPEEVWPWLVQVGCLRAGWYADDLLDHLGRPSARRVVPELQDVHVGTWLPMAPTPDESTAFVVESLDPPREMLWRTPTSTWAWRLVPLEGGRTRVVTRLRARYDRSRPGALTGVLLMEFGDFPMMRRMLRGVRERAEAEHRRRFPPSLRPRRLAVVRGVHTAAWFVVESCVGWLLWSGLTGRSDRRAAVAAAVVTGECLVFAGNGFRCPLTGLAEAAGAASGSVTDLYLPRWFARSLPAVHVPLLVLIAVLHRRARLHPRALPGRRGARRARGCRAASAGSSPR